MREVGLTWRWQLFHILERPETVYADKTWVKIYLHMHIQNKTASLFLKMTAISSWSTRPTHSHDLRWSLFLHVLSVRPFPLFKISQNNFEARIVIATGGTVSLAEWIIDGTHVLFYVWRLKTVIGSKVMKHKSIGMLSGGPEFYLYP